MTKVIQIPGALNYEGKSYGPFEATGDIPYVEVPADMAAVMGLPLHESELVKAAEFQNTTITDYAAADQQVADLTAQRDALKAEVEGLQRSLADANTVAEQEQDARTKLTTQRDSLLTDLAGAIQARDTAEASLKAYQDTVGDLLPEGFPGRARLFAARLFSAADLDGYDQAGLEELDGIGDKTASEILAALETAQK